MTSKELKNQIGNCCETVRLLSAEAHAQHLPPIREMLDTADSQLIDVIIVLEALQKSGYVSEF